MFFRGIPTPRTEGQTLLKDGVLLEQGLRTHLLRFLQAQHKELSVQDLESLRDETWHASLNGNHLLDLSDLGTIHVFGIEQTSASSAMSCHCTKRVPALSQLQHSF